MKQQKRLEFKGHSSLPNSTQNNATNSPADIAFDMFYYSSVKGNDPKVLLGGRFAGVETRTQFGNWKYIINKVDEGTSFGPRPQPGVVPLPPFWHIWGFSQMFQPLGKNVLTWNWSQPNWHGSTHNLQQEFKTADYHKTMRQTWNLKMDH